MSGKEMGPQNCKTVWDWTMNNRTHSLGSRTKLNTQSEWNMRALISNRSDLDFSWSSSTWHRSRSGSDRVAHHSAIYHFRNCQCASPMNGSKTMIVSFFVVLNLHRDAANCEIHAIVLYSRLRFCCIRWSPSMLSNALLRSLFYWNALIIRPSSFFIHERNLESTCSCAGAHTNYMLIQQFHSISKWNAQTMAVVVRGKQSEMQTKTIQREKNMNQK